jgi:hypothetical protein
MPETQEGLHRKYTYVVSCNAIKIICMNKVSVYNKTGLTLRMTLTLLEGSRTQVFHKAKKLLKQNSKLVTVKTAWEHSVI